MVKRMVDSTVDSTGLLGARQIYMQSAQAGATTYHFMLGPGSASFG